MLQNQGMNWNFLEALPKRRKAMGAHAKLGLLDADFFFQSKNFPLVACGRLGAYHKHSPGGWNVIVRRLAVCLTAG